jgi:serine phosphatase RsbU (regulator of sigma subunit)/CHASE3 domain sensor protein
MPLRRTIIPWIAPWVITLISIAVALLVAGVLIRNSVAASFDTGQRVRNSGTLLFAAVRAQLDEETGLRGYLATHDPTFLEPYYAAKAELPVVLPHLRAALQELNLSSAVAAVEDAKRANDTWIALVATPVLAHNGRSNFAQPRLGKSLVDRFRFDRTIADEALAARNDDLRNDLQADLLRLSILIVTATVLLLGVGLTFATLTARAWNRLDAAREQREEARRRERDLRVAYEAERRVVGTLQEAFSQRALPKLSSMNFSATYVPAAEEAKVGGDWYDAFAIGPERVLFSIGDIAGHGLEAAVTMSRVRDEMLSAALLDSNVESILERVNERIMLGGTAWPMITAIVGIADAQTCTFEYATAGHPPPVLLEPGKQPRLLPFSGLPLGVSEKAVYRVNRVETVPQAILVLYTDGAVEHSRNIIDGEHILIEAVARASDTEDKASAIYRTIFRNRQVGDDVAILTIGFASRPAVISRKAS